MAKMKYACGYCNDRFATLTDHAIHVTTTCGAAAHERGQRNMNYMNCWMCGEQVHKSDLQCNCGWSYKPTAAAS